MEVGSTSAAEELLSDSDANKSMDMQKYIEEKNVVRFGNSQVVVERRDIGALDSTVDQASGNFDQQMDGRDRK